LISIQTYSQIVEQSVELAIGEYPRLTQENREERRKINEKKSNKFVQSYGGCLSERDKEALMSKSSYSYLGSKRESLVAIN
jgi:hypothetical protein